MLLAALLPILSLPGLITALVVIAILWGLIVYLSPFPENVKQFVNLACWVIAVALIALWLLSLIHFG